MQHWSLQLKQKRVKIAFVPTMGYLHEGHISLVKEARRLVGKNGKVVVSIYVNPTQFAPQEDLSKYPRDLRRDKMLCRRAGVDLIFAPGDQEMYPAPTGLEFSTFVSEEKVSRTMEGSSRPTHFRGVATVVAKLFNIVLPDISVFGAKDFQQAAVVQRMVRDLNFPLTIVVAPTQREPDGLALSSRNKYLSTEERTQAIALWLMLQQAKKMVTSKGVSAEKMKSELQKILAARPATRLDYMEFFNPDTLLPEKIVRKGTQMALAVFVGKTRLIDNAQL